MSKNYGHWIYNSEDGLYYLDDFGIGLTFTEVETLEDSVEVYEVNKRAKLAELNEY